MADLVTRLLLNTQQFDNNIGKSTKQIQGFQQNIEKFSTGAVSAFTKFAGVVGIAVSATELLQKGLNSNAHIQDQFNSYMEAGSKVTDQFFSSLLSGDWSVFNNGILEAIDNAKEYSETYRDLQRMLRSTSVRYEQTDARKTQLEAIIEDDTKPLEERKKAQAELDRTLLMGVADIREASQIVENELNKMMATATNGENSFRYINTSNIQETVLDLMNAYSPLRRNLDEYRNIRSTANQLTNPNVFEYTGDEWYKIQQEASTKYYQNYTAETRAYYDELIRLQDTLTEETYNAYQDLFDRMNDLNDKAGTWEKDRAGARDEIINAEAEALEESSKSSTKSGIVEGVKEATKVELEPIEVPVRLLTESDLEKSGVNKKVQADIASGYINIKPIEPETIQSNYDYMESLNGIASVMGSITNLTNEGAAGWLAYGANLISSVAQAIPLIQTLTTALQAKAIAEAAGSAASVPIVGWINAIAAISALMAAFASIPKFADGGIFTGNSFIGDNMLARVNSGEMILNNRQQRNLFNLLDGNVSKNPINSGSVEFKIQGKELVGVLNAYSNKTNKYR